MKAREHNLLAAPLAETVLEPRVGGGIVDRAQVSEVEVTFTATGEGGTRVVLEHRHLDRHGPGWEGGLRDSLDSDQGWPLYLQRFEAMTAPV